MRIATFLRIVAIAAAFAICLPLAGARGQELTVIRVGLAGADDISPMLYAMHAGLLKRIGVEVTVVPTTSGAASSAGVAGGSIDIAGSSLVPIIGAHARGVPFLFIAPGTIYSTDAPYAAMVVKKDGPIKTARDLNGKVVSSSALKDLIATSNLAWIDQNGGDSTTVRTVELPPSTVLPAIEEGRIDAGTLLEPRLSEALDSGKVRVLGKSFDSYGKHFMISGWFATADYISRHADLVARIARVLREANAYANAHHGEKAPLLAAFTKVDVKSIEHATRAQYGDALDLKEMQNVIDITAKYKVIEKPFDARELVSPVVQFLVR